MRLAVLLKKQQNDGYVIMYHYICRVFFVVCRDEKMLGRPKSSFFQGPKT